MFTDEDRQAMDSAAVDAENDAAENIPDEPLNVVANWWKKHYIKAGHKRLAAKYLQRILLRYASKEE